MNKRHLKNLTKLADFLENDVDNSQFNIFYYRQKRTYHDLREYLTPASFYSKTDCGTIGCALGWAPFAIKTKHVKVLNNNTDAWLTFSELVFGLKNSDEWAWCFASTWKSNRQRSRLATVKRIRRLIKAQGKLTEQMRIFLKRNSLFLRVEHENPFNR